MNQSELKSDLIAWLEQQWDKAVKDSETPDKELLEKYTFYDGLTTAYEFTIARLNSADRWTPRGFAMPWSRMRGTVYAFRFACMHLYASGDAYKKGLEKARKPLYIKEKTEFLSLVCIVCINIRGFLPFSRILYKGMMYTMHTRAEAAPERRKQAETENGHVCIP